jgi:hypothetical protein
VGEGECREGEIHRSQLQVRLILCFLGTDFPVLRTTIIPLDEGRIG